MPDTPTPEQANGNAASQGRPGSAVVARATATAPGRQVFGFMAFAMLFSVVGAEVRATSQVHGATTGKAVGSGLGKALDQPVTIFLGGTVATSLLVLLADTGSTGAQLAQGLAGLTLVTSLLVNGSPVWGALGNLFGSKPTTPLSGTTGTSPTASTTAAVATVATAAA